MKTWNENANQVGNSWEPSGLRIRSIQNVRLWEEPPSGGERDKVPKKCNKNKQKNKNTNYNIHTNFHNYKISRPSREPTPGWWIQFAIFSLIVSQVYIFHNILRKTIEIGNFVKKKIIIVKKSWRKKNLSKTFLKKCDNIVLIIHNRFWIIIIKFIEPTHYSYTKLSI